MKGPLSSDFNVACCALDIPLTISLIVFCVAVLQQISFFRIYHRSLIKNMACFKPCFRQSISQSITHSTNDQLDIIHLTNFLKIKRNFYNYILPCPPNKITHCSSIKITVLCLRQSRILHLSSLNGTVPCNPSICHTFHTILFAMSRNSLLSGSSPQQSL